MPKLPCSKFADDRDDFNVALVLAWTRASQKGRRIVERSHWRHEDGMSIGMPALYFVDKDKSELPTEETLCRDAKAAGFWRNAKTHVKAPKNSTLAQFVDFFNHAQATVQ